jgi:hypothetical protein
VQGKDGFQYKSITIYISITDQITSIDGLTETATIYNKYELICIISLVGFFIEWDREPINIPGKTYVPRCDHNIIKCITLGTSRMIECSRCGTFIQVLNSMSDEWIDRPDLSFE